MQTQWTTSFLVVAICLLFEVNVVNGDTPANCTYDDILGDWVFHIGEDGHDRKLNCTGFGNEKNAPKKAIKLSLYFPNLVVDQFGNEGVWTMIYNQGFEAVVAGKKYFAFSKYEVIGHKVISFCDQTFPGWSHDTFGRNWACYIGRKAEHVSAKFDDLLEERPKRISYGTIMQSVNEINEQQKMWKAAPYTKFQDLTMDQLIAMTGGRKSNTASFPKPARVTEEQTREAAKLPHAFDWRNVNGINYVSPIRNQGGCGSCYAFASTAMLEARWRIMSNNTIKPIFSPQDIVECSQYSQGCAGGFSYLIGGKYAEDFGMVEESCNPYSGVDNATCNTETSCKRYYATNYEFLGGFYGACNEALMKLHLVRNGPLAIAFEVYNDFFWYQSGIYHHTGLMGKYSPFELVNHEVLLVGYGTDMSDPRNPQDYWIVKNSWGTGWGEDGYFRIRRGNDECGIESLVAESFPVM